VLEKFNFYDIYGYFIPGAVLLVLLYAPFTLTGWQPTVPLGEFSTVVLAVIVSYLIGYFMQSMATNAVPSKFDGLYPSVRLLNPSDHTFATKLKETISVRCLSRFGIDPEISKEARSHPEVESARNTAFRLARAATNARRSGTYSEQYQGLYSMMRGLAITFAFGCLYMIGWSVSLWHYHGTPVIAFWLEVLSLAATLGLAIWRYAQGFESGARKAADVWGLVAVAGLALGAGAFVGQTEIFDLRADLIFWASVVVFLAAALRFYVSYELFSNEFAKAVWTGFCVIDPNKG
jgi:hypothetical protein